MTEFIGVLSAYPMAFMALAVTVGLLVGSFLNVVILRLPPVLEYAWKQDYADFTETELKESKPPGIAFTRSHCPQCKTQLKAWHNIPVISYLLLRGKCGFCHKKIPFRYPLVELMSALLIGFAAYQYGVTLAFVSACLLIWMLLVITWIDIDTFLIPDQLSLSLLWLGLFFSLFEFTITPSAAIVGALIGYLSLWTVFHLFKLATGKEGMGYGDFKLLAAGGAWLGAEALIVVLFIASISGLLIAVVQKLMNNYQNKIPFGPYLSIGILVSYLFSEEILNMLFPAL
ncbi:prepilin peptidase [Marinicella sp. S1101]|uniref:prepilin peptidase n=1 Tax=Marinicella marina TaxID=2996016 RepID=UPI002260DEBA|nr:A24 family peptidase [Marinicella marina]MCX7553609.1 prepilin peptidase [Marinicella marina]MDJ1140233.1 prepilin peptidase [Marinicella marina]